jgi:hypothetical protein
MPLIPGRNGKLSKRCQSISLPDSCHSRCLFLASPPCSESNQPPSHIPTSSNCGNRRQIRSATTVVQRPALFPCVGLHRQFASRIGRPRGFSHSSGLFGLNLQIVDNVLHPAHFFGYRGGLVFCRGVLNDSGQIDGALYCLDADP